LKFELSSKDNIPKFRANSKTIMLATIMMLIMIFLKSVKVGLWMLASI